MPRITTYADYSSSDNDMEDGENEYETEYGSGSPPVLSPADEFAIFFSALSSLYTAYHALITWYQSPGHSLRAPLLRYCSICQTQCASDCDTRVADLRDLGRAKLRTFTRHCRTIQHQRNDLWMPGTLEAWQQAEVRVAELRVRRRMRKAGKRFREWVREGEVEETRVPYGMTLRAPGGRTICDNWRIVPG